MEITIKFGSKMTVKTTGKSQKEAMASLGIFADAEPKCGNCGSDAIVPKVRKVEKGSYYELKCCDCGHVLSLGQNRDEVNLFPKGDWEPPYQGKRRDDDTPTPPDAFDSDDDDSSDVPF